ncbi:NAD(P)-binding protein [Mycena latifolia]|nr:NAD(P)-binding protein [Mycena latifolia]
MSKPEFINLHAHAEYIPDEFLQFRCAAVTAYNALRGLEPVKAGQTVLIPGTGGVATQVMTSTLFALQFAVAMDATAIVTSSSDAKLAEATVRGAAHVVNYWTTPAWDTEVVRLTNGVGVDHVLEASAMIGGPTTLVRSMKAARIGGTIDIIAASWGPDQARRSHFPDIMQPAVMKSLKFRGITIGSVALFREINAFIAEHQIRPVVAKVFPFEEAKAAYAYLETQTHVGRVIIEI